MSFRRFKSSKYSQKNLAEPLLASYNSPTNTFDRDLRILDDIDDLMNEVELPTFVDKDNHGVDSSDEDDSKSSDDEQSRGNVAKLKDGQSGSKKSKYDDEPEINRRITAKVKKIDEDIKLSRKFEKYLTIENEDIIDRNDKIDALILQLKLPHIYILPDDEQYEIIQEKYPWIDDEDGEIDQFQYEEIQEVVGHMTAIERRHMYDTREEYDEDKEEIRDQYVLVPVQFKTMRRYNKMLNDGKKYACSGCGVLLDFQKKKFAKQSKSWKGYTCKKTQNEFIFHNRLCVKFRKAKEWIRDAVHQYNKERKIKSARMQIEFVKDEGLDPEFRPTRFYTTFDEQEKKKVKWTKTIRKYYIECINTDLRGYDIDEGDRFADIPTAIKYLDMREFAIPMFKYLIREVHIKKFSLFWQLIQFFTSYIHTPKMIELLKESSDTLFPLHDDTDSGDTSEFDSTTNELISFLTIICEGALYPIATCLYVSAYLKENGENYWNEEETESLCRHFRSMANTIIDEVESEHLVAIMLETPTNIYDNDGGDDEENNFENQTKGLSVIDIAIKYKMLRFLQNHKISRIATTLWYERKIIHPNKRFGEDLSTYEIFQRLRKTPAKFYFSPSGLNIVRLTLYLVYLALFSYVTIERKYNYETAGIIEWALWLFNIAAILYESYKCFTGPKTYFGELRNINEFVKAILWIALFCLKFAFPMDPTDERFECIYVVTSADPITIECGVSFLSAPDNSFIDSSNQNNNNNNNANFTLPPCIKRISRQDPYICTPYKLHNDTQVEAYMLLWSIQCILFWMTLVFYLQRTRSTGPLLNMIGVMTKDIINFLFMVSIFWIAISLSIYYIVADDLENFEYFDGDGVDGVDDARRTLGSLSSCMYFGLLTILGNQQWETVEGTSPAVGLPRSYFLDGITALTAVIGTILLLNLLIAMLSSSFNEVSEISHLEVNYIRIVQSYAASRDISLIPAPFNYFAFMLMAIWFIIDLLVTACTARTKMLNDWFFTPLNRSVFSAGDFIEYYDIPDEDYEFHQALMNNKGKKPKGYKCSGYVQHQFTSEVAQIQVADRIKFVHKDNINSIKKEILTERLSDADANGICASITSSGRYYCKYCRYFFHGDQVGNVEQVSNLFRYYGILLDDDDIGKLSNMLGEGHNATEQEMKILKKKRKKKKKKVDLKTEEAKADDYNRNLRTLGVAQLCPECYRPFYCSEDHMDEVQRLQYLSEVCSFWVFMATLWLPLVVAFFIPGFISYIYQIIVGQQSLFGGNKAKEEKQQQKLAKKIKLIENNDKYRENVVKQLHGIRPTQEYILDITARVTKIHKKIRESVADDEEDNIITQTQEYLQLKKLELTPQEGLERMQKLKKLHAYWLKKLDKIIDTISEKQKKKQRERLREQRRRRKY